jgi:hypothetical protein
MVMIENYNTSFEEYAEQSAIDSLTDEQYHEYQGLFLSDKVRFLAKCGINIVPIAKLNGITI